MKQRLYRYNNASTLNLPVENHDKVVLSEHLIPKQIQDSSLSCSTTGQLNANTILATMLSGVGITNRVVVTFDVVALAALCARRAR